MDPLPVYPQQISKPDLGLILPVGQATSAWLAAVNSPFVAEEKFESVWLRDIPFATLPTSDRSSEYHIFSLMAFMCSKVRRMKIGSAVISTLWRDPIDIARAVATIQELASSEILVGLGRGTPIPRSVMKALRFRTCEFADDYLTIHNLLCGNSTLTDTSVTVGMPQCRRRSQLFAATNSNSFWQRCGSACSGWITYAASPATMASRIGVIRALANNSKLKVLMQLNLTVEEGDDFDAMITSIHGVNALRVGPSTLSSLFSAYAAAGVSRILLYLPREERFDEQLELILSAHRISSQSPGKD
jgi:hypothetical protein